MDRWEDQVDFVRGMSAAAAKILWILLISGRSLDGRELEFACNLSDKPIKQGLAWLEFKGLIQNNGKFNGWSLTAAAKQLPLPHLQLENESRNASHDRKYSDHELTSSSSIQINNTNLAVNTGEEEEKKESRKYSDFLQKPENKPLRQAQDKQLRQCLVAAGIGRRSKKLGELLELDLDLKYVNAHIAARKIMLANGEKYPPGWLINKLIDGDAVPIVTQKSCPKCGMTHYWSERHKQCMKCR